MESALQSKRADIVQRIHNEFQSAQRRENLLAATIRRRHGWCQSRPPKVAHYNVLKREVDSNRELYDSMLRSVQEAGVSSALRASNIRMVDSAVPQGPADISRTSS